MHQISYLHALAAGTSCDSVARGAYVVRDTGTHPDVILMGTGSELQIAYDAAEVSGSP